MSSDTPRTDAAIQAIDQREDDPFATVIGLARALERELAAARDSLSEGSSKIREEVRQAYEDDRVRLQARINELEGKLADFTGDEGNLWHELYWMLERAGADPYGGMMEKAQQIITERDDARVYAEETQEQADDLARALTELVSLHGLKIELDARQMDDLRMRMEDKYRERIGPAWRKAGDVLRAYAAFEKKPKTSPEIGPGTAGTIRPPCVILGCRNCFFNCREPHSCIGMSGKPHPDYRAEPSPVLAVGKLTDAEKLRNIWNAYDYETRRDAMAALADKFRYAGDAQYQRGEQNIVTALVFSREEWEALRGCLSQGTAEAKP